MKIIGISGLARCGKDSFFGVSSKILKESSQKSCRFAFADELKLECNNFLKTNTGISAFTEDPKEKELIRPFLVCYGTHIRRKINKNCWISKVENKLNDQKYKDYIVFITDVRYDNEIEWIHSKKGHSIHIERVGNKAPNEEELANDPILKSKSMINLRWQNFDNLESGDITSTVEKTLKEIL